MYLSESRHEEKTLALNKIHIHKTINNTAHIEKTVNHTAHIEKTVITVRTFCTETNIIKVKGPDLKLTEERSKQRLLII